MGRRQLVRTRRASCAHRARVGAGPPGRARARRCPPPLRLLRGSRRRGAAAARARSARDRAARAPQRAGGRRRGAGGRRPARRSSAPRRARPRGPGMGGDPTARASVAVDPRALRRAAVTTPSLALAGWHGDDLDRSHAVLADLLAAIRVLRPDVEVLAVGPDPHAISALHGITAVPLGDPATVDGALATASAVFVGGGPPWEDGQLTVMGGIASLLAFEGPGDFPRRWKVSLPAVLQVALLAVMRGVPLHLHSIRLDSFDDEGAVALAGLLVRNTTSVSAADTTSATRLAAAAARPEPLPVIDTASAALEVVAPLIPTTGAAPALPTGRLRRRREGPA